MDELLAKYVRNECSEEERQWVIGWLQNPANESQLRSLMRKQWNAPPNLAGDAPDWQRMWVGVARQTKDLPAETEPSIYRTVWQQVVRIAIWISCIIALGLGIRVLRQSQLPPDIIYQSGEERSMTVELTGATAILNKNSVLRVSSDWAGPNRNVWLDGEGLITVNPQPAGYQMLIHITDQVLLETRGATLFVSRKDGRIQAVVQKGKANFIVQYLTMSDIQRLRLKPGDMADYNESNEQLAKRQVNPAHYLSRVTGH
ncbi:hypothetical protein [Larkinella soli]|uniref:hypothetical protein n=1 Tax=Larkinella soli TaxID=1770527 RepID=UPI000FFC8379|nr:hypothetical protein [Larkinella soli]